jgi:tRNA A-37 threonylcarbamoyl transferase component Bud32
LPYLEEQIKAALADHYAIERELGSGGMATVYLAHDLKHQRQVAVKVLKPELAAALGSERFLREIQITARLNHPHILPLLDSGAAEGFLYYVMPYVVGESLRRRLNLAAPVPLDDVVRITQQVAAALDHAHRHDVIHRDIKPENILFSEGLAIVADFGIAKAVSVAGRAALTRSGFPVGTPGYMSPEQAAGNSELDARTDVCSLACVVYEMLVGETPGVWSMPDEVKLGRFLELSQGHRDRLEKFPGRVEQVLVRALAIRSADRFGTPVDFAAALAAVSERGTALADTEVQQILGRAAELDAALPTQGSALSLGGVEQVAAQAGIPPERVREAMGELERPPASKSVIQGAPAVAVFSKEKLTVDRTVEGEVTAASHEMLVMEIQTALGIAGHVSTLGNSLTWSPAAPGSETRKVVVTVAPRAGATHIHVEERLELAGWRLFAPGWGAAAGALFGFGSGALLGVSEVAVAVQGLICAFAGAFLSVQGFIRIPARRRKPQLEQLTDRLAALVSADSSTK